jgi:nitrate/nitrite transporter NarK
LAVAAPGSLQSVASEKPFGLSITTAHALLCVAGVACCVAMAMPQVHIVAYCTDLGFGAARGAEMLSIMLACGIVSRLVSGAICDRIGGLKTLVLGSVLQGLALFTVLAVRWHGVTLCHLGFVWFVSGRHCAVVRHHCERVFSGATRRCVGRGGHHGHHDWHGLGRLDVGQGV